MSYGFDVFSAINDMGLRLLQTRHNELKERMRQLTATVEGLLNAGVHHLNARLIELDMTDVTTPAEMINRLGVLLIFSFRPPPLPPSLVC